MKSKFVLAQLEQKGLPEENLENAKKAVAEAMELYKPDLMVFPECFMSHFPMGTDRATCLGTAQTLDGPFVTGMKALAKDNGIWIIFGMNEKVEDEILAVDETRYMRMHPSIGYAILADYDYNQTVLDAVLYHHEHYDGTGYPHNLVGKQIPLVGRIMHVCDIFGALISNRDYREGFDVETALDIMIDEVKNFDMKVFLAFQRVAFSDGVMETVMEKGNLDELFEEEQE